MKIIALHGVFTAISLLFPSTILFAFDVEGHRRITRKAIEFVEIAEIQQFKDEIIEGAGGIEPDPLGLGLESEDTDPVPGPEELFNVSTRWARNLNHGYNPYAPAGKQAWPTPPRNANCWIFDWSVMPAIQWANSIQNYFTWNNAIKQYLLGNKAEAYHILGHIVHLVEDMSVPAHTYIIDHGLNWKKLALAQNYVPQCILDSPGFAIVDALEEYMSKDEDIDTLLCCKAATPRFNSAEE